MTDFKSDFNLFDDDDSYYEESTPQLTKTRQQPETLHFAYSPLIINERRSTSLPPEPSQDRRSNSLEDQRRGYDHPFTITGQSF